MKILVIDEAVSPYSLTLFVSNSSRVTIHPSHLAGGSHRGVLKENPTMNTNHAPIPDVQRAPWEMTVSIEYPDSLKCNYVDSTIIYGSTMQLLMDCNSRTPPSQSALSCGSSGDAFFFFEHVMKHESQYCSKKNYFFSPKYVWHPICCIIYCWSVCLLLQFQTVLFSPRLMETGSIKIMSFVTLVCTNTRGEK